MVCTTIDQFTVHSSYDEPVRLWRNIYGTRRWKIGIILNDEEIGTRLMAGGVADNHGWVRPRAGLAGFRRSWWPRTQEPGSTALQSPATRPQRDRGASDTAGAACADWGAGPSDTAGPCSHSSLLAWPLLKVVCRCQVPSSLSSHAGL